MNLEATIKKLIHIDSFDVGKFAYTRNIYRKLRDRKEWILHGIPKKVYIETTRKCNLKCRYCVRQSLIENGTLKPIDMSEEVFELVLEQVSTLDNVTLIGLSGLGEPFLDKKIVDRITTVKRLFPQAFVGLTSNGTLLDRVGDRIIGVLDGLSLSLNFWCCAVVG